MIFEPADVQRARDRLVPVASILDPIDYFRRLNSRMSALLSSGSSLIHSR